MGQTIESGIAGAVLGAGLWAILWVDWSIERIDRSGALVRAQMERQRIQISRENLGLAKPGTLSNMPSVDVPFVDLLPNFLLFIRDSTSTGCSGYVHHVEHNASGGSVQTPVAHFVAYIENATDDQPNRWEVNLFMRRDIDFDLSAIPLPLGEWLLEHSACKKPMDLMIHEANNVDALEFGETWFDD